jgi:hypothetical protein
MNTITNEFHFEI